MAGVPDLHSEAPLRLSWRQLYRQFGADPDKASDATLPFKLSAASVLRELKKIKLAWPESELHNSQGRADPASLDSPPSHRFEQPLVAS